jgi:hypothetical protein
VNLLIIDAWNYSIKSLYGDQSEKVLMIIGIDSELKGAGKLVSIVSTAAMISLTTL